MHAVHRRRHVEPSVRGLAPILLRTVCELQLQLIDEYDCSPASNHHDRLGRTRDLKWTSRPCRQSVCRCEWCIHSCSNCSRGRCVCLFYVLLLDFYLVVLLAPSTTPAREHRRSRVCSRRSIATASHVECAGRWDSHYLGSQNRTAIGGQCTSSCTSELTASRCAYLSGRHIPCLACSLRAVPSFVVHHQH